MQLSRRTVGLLGLLALTCAPERALRNAQAEPPEPLRLGLRLGYFQQLDSGGISWLNEDASVFQALIMVDAPVGATDRISARVLTDIVSSASIRREQNDSFRALQSEASGVVHVDGRLGWSHRFDRWTLSVTGSGSWDYAYLSFGGGVSAAVRLLDDNATLRLGLVGFWDTLAMIRFNGEDEPEEHRWTVTAEAGWSHVLTPKTVLDVSVSHTAQGGFLAGQFNSVLMGGVEAAEVLPNSRQRTSATVRVKQGIGWRHALEIGARYYHDDWGVDAGTGTLGYELYLNQRRSVLLRMAYRLHGQDGAAAWGESFSAEKGGAAGTHVTSDPDLGPFLGHMGTLGLTLPRPFGEKGGKLDFEGSYYHRSNGLDMFWFSAGWSIDL